ncbi:ricin-type beta-trefoil lectin domain protein [Streptomyces resistomycificus]|uniref:Hydrolase n=1 Tax=Streptomyces resistomycificus TaxID=67356 RepID=A0A0L8LUB7_9ACTN|nr:ricin-type beta-trefoil lectin domain protein [Streptomyces resistomycificus]KOG41802.1 hydrolase [Streptomyces resistomycificus]KUN95773.1 hydrolase [Streptomyces resistomycificus]
MNDAGLSNSPTPARPSDATDEQLSAELRKWSGATPALQPVGELLDRHWEAAFAYARLCTDGARPAGMLTTAAFTRLFGETLRHNGPTSAWRPRLLVTVRRIAAEWDTDRRRELLHPELRTEAGGGERAAARLLPPADRRLLSGAFQRLPQTARCVLWHTEVEAEPLGVPAALLGLQEEDARVELGRARERLREECLQVHRELAPEQECRHYLRLLDVTYRRGGADIDTDLRGHLERCKHCRYTADQLHQFNQGLGEALAEAVLGWAAHAYVEARARAQDVPDDTEREAEALAQRPPFVGESFMPATEAAPAPAAQGDAAAPATVAFDAFETPARATPAPPAGPGPDPSTVPGAPSRPSAPPAGPRTASRRSAHKAARRAARRNLGAAVLTVSGLVVLPLVLWSSLGTSDGTGQADEDRTSGAPDADPGSATADPSWAGAADAEQGTLRGRLHNVASGLCVGVVGEKAVEGAETELTDCSSEAAQQWRYEPDGLLRNADAPDLCLDSHLGYSVRLAPCRGTAETDGKDVRYDFTLQGILVPRWDQDLALTPAATDGGGSLVLKSRDDAPAQRWVIDTSKTDLQMEVVNWGADSRPVDTPQPAPEPSKTPTPKKASPTPSATPSSPEASPTPTPSYPYPADGPCYYNPYYCSGGGQNGGWGGYGPGPGGR